MLKFLHESLNCNLVFYDYSRFYRRAALGTFEFEKLDEHRIYSVSVCNPTIDCTTAGGRTERRRLLNEAEDFSDAHSEKQRDRMRVALLERHCWLGVAPVGYVNVRAQRGEPNIVPEEPYFGFMGRGFEMIDSGTWLPAACLRELTKCGFRTRKSNELTVGGFMRLLENPVYIGKIPSRRYGVQPGIHQPCVSEEMFYRVQRRLKGKNTVNRPYERKRPGLPLRQFIICPKCDHGLTGAPVTNRYGYTYYYYWCTCGFVRVRADKAHEEFVGILDSLRCDAPLCESFVDSLRAKWEARNGDSVTVVAKLKRELHEAESTYEQLLIKHVRGKDPAIEKNFCSLEPKLTAGIDSLKGQIAASEMARATFDDLVAFVRKMPTDLGRIWQKAPVDLQQKVQNTLFPEGLKCDPKKGILNEDNHSVFNHLQEFFSGNVYMADAAGIEPTTCRLREH